MATRRDIREAVYDHLATSVSDTYAIEDDAGNTTSVTISSDEVDLIGPEYAEQTPRVFYQPSTFTHIEFNGVGNAPDEIERSGGTVDYMAWYEYVEGQFFLYVRSERPELTERLYERVRRSFGVYNRGDRTYSDLHPEIQNIEVVESSPSNDLGEKPAIWGDQIELRVTFARRLVIESGSGTLTLPEAVDNLPVIDQINVGLDVGRAGYGAGPYGQFTYGGDTRIRYTHDGYGLQAYGDSTYNDDSGITYSVTTA